MQSVLYCTTNNTVVSVLYYTARYSTVLYNTILYSTILYCTVLKEPHIQLLYQIIHSVLCQHYRVMYTVQYSFAVLYSLHYGNVKLTVQYSFSVLCSLHYGNVKFTVQ